MYEPLFSALQSGGTLVAANRRLARYLLYDYEEQQLAAGRKAWQTPDIVSWSAWLSRLWQLSRLHGGVAADLTLLGEERCNLLWESVVDGPGRSGIGVPTPQLARMARKSWGLLQEWEVADAPEWDGFELTRDQRTFCGWFRAYRQKLSDNAWADTESLASLLHADIAAGLLQLPGSLTFVGFDTWPPARARLREACAAAGTPVTELHSEREPSAAVAIAAEDSRHEVELAASWAREHREAAPTSRVAVIIPDLSARATEVNRIFRDVLAPDWRCGQAADTIPLNISYGRPLADFPLTDNLFRLFRASNGQLEFNELSLLLRSPWLAGGITEAQERAQLELRLRRFCRADVSLAAIAGTCRKYAPRFGDIVSAITERADKRNRTAAEWSTEFGELAHAAGWPGDESPDSETWQLLDAWQNLQRDFADAGEVLGRMSRASAIAHLGRMAQQKLFQPEGPRGGIEVMGTLEAAGHQFDAVWVTGMAREIWPPAGNPDPLIPVELQRRLGMPDATAEQSLDFARRVTGRLRCCAEQLVFSWPSLADEQPYSCSPLIGDLPVQEATAGFEFWNRSGITATGPMPLDDDVPPPLPGSGRVGGGMSVFRSQVVCPAAAFIEQRLGGRELESLPVGLSARERGIVVHDVLEKFYDNVRNQSALAALDAAAVTTRVDELLDAELAELHGSDEPFFRRLLDIEKLQLLTRIVAFIALDAQRAPFTIEEREQYREVQVGPIEVGLKADRIDVLPEGGRLVLDYKTGRVDRRNWNPQRPVDLQLPLYATRVAAETAGIAFAQVSAQGVRFEGVGNGGFVLDGIDPPGRQRGKVRFKARQDDEVIEEWETLLGVWDELLVELAGEFAAGDFRIDPANPNAARGQYAPLTRIHELELLDDSGGES